MEISDILLSIQNGTLWTLLAVLIVLSYLLYVLFSWSFVKPCKYIGVCSIIVGVLLIIVRFANSFIINIILSEIKIPNSLIISIFKPFLKMGIIYIIIGIGLIVLQHYYYKNKSKDNLKHINKVNS